MQREYGLDVSIVIPTYNSSSFIQETLTSVQASAIGFSYEIILVDDCSKDIEELEKIVEQKTNTVLIKKEKKSNAAVSRNLGINAAKGEFIFLLDSDDHFTEDHISHRIGFMRRYECDFVIGAYINVGEAGENVICEMPASRNAKDFLFVEDKDVRTSTISFESCMKDRFKFNEKLDKHQDWGFLIDTSENSHHWEYDSNPGVRINCERNERMSGSMNMQASQYFMKHYLSEPLHISGFCKRHFVLAALTKNKEAYRYFSAAIIPSRIKLKFRLIKFVGDGLTSLGLFPLLPGLLNSYKMVFNRLAKK